MRLQAEHFLVLGLAVGHTVYTLRTSLSPLRGQRIASKISQNFT